MQSARPRSAWSRLLWRHLVWRCSGVRVQRAWFVRLCIAGRARVGGVVVVVVVRERALVSHLVDSFSHLSHVFLLGQFYSAILFTVTVHCLPLTVHCLLLAENPLPCTHTNVVSS